MATFTAKTKDEIDPLYPVTPPTQKILEPLPKMADGTSMNHYYHRSTTDTVEDVLRPGRFDHMKDTFRSGAQKSVVHLVTCLLGEIETGLTRMDIHLWSPPGSTEI